MVTSLSFEQTIPTSVSLTSIGATLIEVLVIFESNDLSIPVDTPNPPLFSCKGASLAAIKGSLSLCVQSLTTNVVNGSTDTVVLETYTDLDWRANFFPPQDPTLPNWWTQLNGTGSNFTTNGIAIGSLGKYLSIFAFNGSANLAEYQGGDNYINWSPGAYLAKDLVGVDWVPQARDTSIRNFKARLDNIATAMTNM